MRTPNQRALHALDLRSTRKAWPARRIVTPPLWCRQSNANEVSCTHGYVLKRGQMSELGSAGGTVTASATGSSGARYVFVKAGIIPTNLSTNSLEVSAAAPWSGTDFDLNEWAYLLLATVTYDGASTLSDFSRRYLGGDWYLHGL